MSSPSGYCVGRYPFKREVSRNALNVLSLPTAVSLLLRADSP